MIKHKDDVSMDYLHYLRATLAAKNRKRGRLIGEMVAVVCDIDKLNKAIKSIEKDRIENGGIKNGA